MADLIIHDAPGGQSDAQDPLLDGLNGPQREAVTHRGPALLIVAGAGSGKTRVLTHRIASLLRGGEAWPSQILAITFTNKAATEMRERVHALIGDAGRGMWISTFHSACVRILRNEAEAFGFPKTFTIYDSGDSRALIKRLAKEHGADGFGITPAQIQGRISKSKNELVDADAYARSANFSDPSERTFVEIFADYERQLRKANAFDFDDLIAQTVYLFRAFDDIADKYRERFRHILVDEYQDTNHAQYALIRELTKQPGSLADAASLTVVGDSDQSIYAFRGADIRNISEFERDFTGAKVVLLEQNYRSTQNILSAANAVISNNFDRKAKKLWTDVGAGEPIVGYTGYSQHDEAQFIADEIDALHTAGVPYREMAVFYRTNSQSRALEEIFIRAALPYKIIGGTKFYERAEIKDALAYLISVANPADDMAIRRVLNRPRRGIGDVTETTIARFATTHGISFRDALAHGADLGVGPKIVAAIAQLDALLREASALLAPADGTVPPATAVSEGLKLLLEKSGYFDMLRKSDDPQDEARLENLDEFVAVARDFARHNPEGTLVDFLTDVALVADSDDLDDESGAVSLMTMHTAKGLEFDTVFLTGVEEDLIPHRISAGEPGGPQEERRLFYVGVTRARKRLYLTLAMTRAQFGEISPSIPSRFLEEIPSELIDWRQSPEQLMSRSITRSGGYGGGYGNGRFQATRGGGVGGVGGAGNVGGGTGGDSAGRSRNLRPLKPLGVALDKFPGAITGKMRDNSDLELAAGDRIRHDDFGEGRVELITGIDAKRIAHVRFDSAGQKKLLIKVAPIEKL